MELGWWTDTEGDGATIVRLQINNGHRPPKGQLQHELVTCESFAGSRPHSR